MITEHLMRPGSGSLSLTDPPLSITKAIYDATSGVGGHVVIAPTRFDIIGTTPVMGDAPALAAALYTGRVTARPSRNSLEFTGLSSWLDTYSDTDLTRAAGTISQWVGDIATNGLTTGTTNASGTSNVTRTVEAHSASRREALDAIAGLGSWEYRVNPNGTIDAATAANLFGATPTLVITRHRSGPDGVYRGIDGGIIDQNVTIDLYSTKAVVLAEGDGPGVAKGTATQAIALKTLSNGTPTLIDVISSPSEPSANANTVAANYLNLRNLRRQVDVSSSTPNVRRYVEPGDYVYLYDVTSGLVDTTNQIVFRGDTIFPIKVRALSIGWPIDRGYGVYFRTNDAAPAWYDLTPFMEWEDGDAFWTIGDWSPPSYGRTNRSDPEVETRIAGTGQLLGYVNGATSDQTLITAITDITGLSVTFTAVSTRLYATTIVATVTQVTAGGVVQLAIADGASATQRDSVATLATNDQMVLVVRAIETGLSGSVTRKGRVATSAGTVTLQGSATRRCTIIVEDLGPA